MQANTPFYRSPNQPQHARFTSPTSERRILRSLNLLSDYSNLLTLTISGELIRATSKFRNRKKNTSFFGNGGLRVCVFESDFGRTEFSSQKFFSIFFGGVGLGVFAVSKSKFSRFWGR